MPVRRRAGLAAAVSSAALVLTACTSSPEAAKDPAAKPTGVASSATPTTSSALGAAKVLAAQYDYAGARAALAQDTSTEAKAELAAVDKAAAAARPYADNSTISHVFYHSLVVDPAKAFHSGDKTQGYLDYMVTEREFRAQLQSMYEKGYVLVHATDIARKTPAGEMAYTPIALPPGKKPLVLSIDDTSYYEYMKGDGFASKLVLQPDGRVLTEYTDGGGVKIGSDDVMPVIDDFVRAHPDFSYHGHKGTMALTGYNGVLGYRTSLRTYKDTPTTHAEIATAKTVAAAMKKNGWLFASHTWGHINVTKASLGYLQADAQRWDTEVRPILGDTPQLIFAFGADISGMPKYTEANEKYHFLHDTEKFDYIFPIDSSRTAWQQLSGGSLRMARINIDGISMTEALKHPGGTLSAFFDTAAVWDPARPKR